MGGGDGVGWGGGGIEVGRITQTTIGDWFVKQLALCFVGVVIIVIVIAIMKLFTLATC